MLRLHCTCTYSSDAHPHNNVESCSYSMTPVQVSGRMALMQLFCGKQSAAFLGNWELVMCLQEVPKEHIHGTTASS